jgi:PPK2 family polyphosphate:nucleotide phosphotransferase
VEQSRDFLWRIHLRVPAKGEIGVFNRSHYEDVLVVRVHNLVPEPVWSRRYETINTFERLLTEGGCTILKCFLHVSHDEQRARIQRRLDDPDRNWKFDETDVQERALWDDYQRAYEDALSRCSNEHAPWHVIPSDRKWAQRWAVSQLLRETLEAMDPRTPPARKDLRGRLVE